MKIEVSNGEIVDKVTILLIKKEKIKDSNKLINIEKELSFLLPCLKNMGLEKNNKYFLLLKRVNCKLWDVEDNLRKLEKNNIFDTTFVELARKVYYINDKRCRLKNKINKITNSGLYEEKSYEKYK
jgi:hypothetical protein